MSTRCPQGSRVGFNLDMARIISTLSTNSSSDGGLLRSCVVVVAPVESVAVAGDFGAGADAFPLAAGCRCRVT